MIYLVGYDEHEKYPGERYNIGRTPMPGKKPHYPRITCFSPTWAMEGDLFAGWLTEEEYRQIYIQLIVERQREVRSFLRSLSPDEDQVWICYHAQYTSEKMRQLDYRQFCHRILIKKFLEKYAHPDLRVVLR